MRKLKLFLDVKAANTPPRGISKASRVIFSVLTLLLLSIGQMWGATTLQKVSAGSLVSGEDYLITATYSNAEYLLEAKTFSAGNSGLLPLVEANYGNVWHFTKSGDVWTITLSTGEGVYFTNANNGVVCAANNGAEFTIEATANNATTSYLKAYDTSNNLRWLALYYANSTAQNWRCYKATSSGVPAIQIYKVISGDTPAKTLESVAISGTATELEYTDGDEFNPAGLVVTGHYSDNSDATISEGITWAFDPATLSEGDESVSVTATVGGKTSDAVVVNGLTVAAAPAASNWQAIAPENLATGDVVVLTMNVGGTYYAASNNNGTSNPPSATSVAVTGSNLSATPATTLQWTVTVVSEGVFQFAVGDKKMYCTDTNNGVRVGTDPTNGTFCNTFDIYTATDSKLYLHTTESMPNAENGRYVGVYNAQNWRCYTSVNNNIKGGSLVIFKEFDSRAAADLNFETKQYLIKKNAEFTAPELVNPNSLSVSYTSSNTDIAEVAANGAITIKADATGAATITASFDGDETYKDGSASYTIFVAEKAGTNEEGEILTEAIAKELIDLGCTLDVYVTGTILTPQYYDQSKTYTVTLTDGFQFYYFYAGPNEEQFDADILTAGDVLVAYGNLKKSGNNYRLNPCYMVSREPYSEPKVDISNTEATAYTPAQAITLYNDVTSDLTKTVYVKGVVVASPAIKYNSELTDAAAVYNGTYNVYVKAENDDSENPTKFEFFRMYADENNSTFEEGDIQVGDVIVAKGILSKYNSTYEFAQGCQMVSKKSKATMTFDDLEMVVNDEEALAPKTITLATAEAVTYAIKEGGDDCITLANGVVTATAEGTATIVATVATVEAYIGTSVEFTVTVSATTPVIDTRKVAESPEGGFSTISGDLSGNEISFAAYKGGAQNEPNGNNTAHELRLYKYQATTEYGGYVTISAKDGCTIDQVVITVGGNCNVGWCKDAEELPTKESTPIAVSTSSAFDTGTGLNASSVSVVNLDASNQFKIKTITVYYNGDAITLESIAISGTASVKEYTDGDEFNPAGLVVTGHYSDNSDAEISDGITWAFDPSPLTVGTTSVSVTATVSEISSSAFEVNGLTVSAVVPPTPSTDNVVILATHGTKLYAMSTSNSNNAFAAIEVTEDGSNIVVTSEEAKAAIQWTRSSNGITATFQDANSKYLTATNGSTNLSLGEDECVWKWYAGEGKNCYSIENEDETKLRSFLYYSNNGIFKNYALSNTGGNYSGIAEIRVIAAENIVVVAPTTHTLSYNANGGTLMEGKDAIAPAQVAENATVTVAANVYEKEGYVFAGWQYGETIYNAGQTFDMPTEDVELIAQWTVISTDNVVILAKCQGQWYAVQGVAGASNHTVAAVPVVYEDNVIYLVESKRASITWERTAAGTLASFKNGENYLSGKTSDSNDLDLGADECWWTYTDQNIYQTHASHSILYSSQVGLFKNYKTTNKSADGESGTYSALPIVVPAVFGDPSYTTVREELAPNAYYTMCLDKAVDAVQGGSVWKIVSKAQGSLDIILEEVTGTLQAGRPYIFYATSDIFKVVYAGSAVLEPVNDDDNNGLIGSFSQAHIDNVNTNYIIYNNELYYVNTDNVYVGAHRAYIDMTAVPDYSEPQQGNAPRRRVTMHTNAPQVATGIDALNASEAPVKIIIEGKLYIIRGEKMFNANGQLVK